MAGLFRLTRAADFDRLYQHHAASVYRYAYAVLGNHADAEDITQQTFLNAYRAIARGTKPRKAENWLLTIVHNEVRRHLRSNQGRAFEVELDERLPQHAPEETEPSVADILRALQHLPPAQRSALVMREFEGRSYAEIAVILNVTQSALETLLFRARRGLADYLEGGLTCAEAEQALSRRVDGRLPRRETRRLRAHLRECPLCTRVAEVQKRQRSLLEGLSVIPIPASLFLFRGEQAAAAGLGAVAAGGSAGVGSGAAAAGAGGAGIAAGLVAKAAAVSAAAAVVGGVGYGVAARPEAVTTPERAATPAAAVFTYRRPVRRMAALVATPAPLKQPRPARPAAPQRKAEKTKTQAKTSKTATAHLAPRVKEVAHLKAKTSPPRSQRARATSAIAVKARPTTRSARKTKPVPRRARALPAVEKKVGSARPAHVANKAAPGAVLRPSKAAGPGPKKAP